MENTKKSRWLGTTVASVLVAAALAACGGSGSTSKPGSPSDPSQPTTPSKPGQPSTPSRPAQPLPPITVPGEVGPFGQVQADWYPVFWEEFEGNELDDAVWNDHIWYEQSHPIINYAVEDGMLKIWPEAPFVDRTIDTDGKFEVTYGFFEMRARLPSGKGTWPAFWLYAHPGTDRPEIDVMEAYAGGGPDSGWSDAALNPINYGITIHKANHDYSYHEVAYAHTMREFAPYQAGVNLAQDFHVYGVEWSAEHVQFYFDGEPLGPVYRNDGYLSKPMYLMLDLWYGSASGEPDGTTPTGKNNSYEIDYVRGWQRAN